MSLYELMWAYVGLCELMRAIGEGYARGVSGFGS